MAQMQRCPNASTFNVSVLAIIITHLAAETIVHLCVCAQSNGCQIVHFTRENAVELKTDTFVLYPDCVFVMRRADVRGGKLANFSWSHSGQELDVDDVADDFGRCGIVLSTIKVRSLTFL